jgi:hypothetical protein
LRLRLQTIGGEAGSVNSQNAISQIIVFNEFDFDTKAGSQLADLFRDAAGAPLARSKPVIDKS